MTVLPTLLKKIPSVVPGNIIDKFLHLTFTRLCPERPER